MFSSTRSKVIAAGAAAVVLAGGSYGIVAATSPSASATTAASSSPAAGSGSGGASNARSGPAAGGSSGTVTSMSSSGFTLTTATGQKVTVKEASATTYEKATSTATSGAVTTGEPVLVLGTTDNTTITAAQVIVQPPSTSGSNPGGQVIGFTQGQQGSTEKAGQIPADYTQGSGTIVSGTTADKATEAALAAYPGGVVDRVVALGNGQYEVHYIGVNWPHHIFVNQDFQVIGADD
ncbi:MAG: PepSY domain-containing protein [Streptosporangiaceae bacterium]